MTTLLFKPLTQRRVASAVTLSSVTTSFCDGAKWLTPQPVSLQSRQRGFAKSPFSTRLAHASTAEPPLRLWANDLSWDKEATHMDDRRSYLPLEHLEAEVAAGRVGALAPRFYCAPTDYSIRRTTEVDAPAILDLCIEDEVDVALLIPL